MEKIQLSIELAAKIENKIYYEEGIRLKCKIINFEINRKSAYQYSKIYKAGVKYDIYKETISYLVISTTDNMKNLCKMKFNDIKKVKDLLHGLAETAIIYDDGFDPEELCIDFPCLKSFFTKYKKNNEKKLIMKKDYSNE